MTSRRRILPSLALLAAMALSLPACTTGPVVGGVASAGVAIAQERSAGNAVDDGVITFTINERLFRNHIDLFQAVGVEVYEGRVLLTGSVPQPDDRIEAVRIAWLADGVTEVLNEIQVTDQGGLINFARDTWVTTQLRSKLLLDENVRAINFNVETVNGVVYLIGIAQDQAELERVTNHARTITNVVKVVSHARLKDDPVN
ncbi:MAG: BON domain-containing protein [Alphaproteobacteria bacterium]